MFTGHFPQKSSVISGSFAKNNLQFNLLRHPMGLCHPVSYASSPPCTDIRNMTVSTEIATPSKSATSRNSDFLVSRGANSN